MPRTAFLITGDRHGGMELTATLIEGVGRDLAVRMDVIATKHIKNLDFMSVSSFSISLCVPGFLRQQLARHESKRPITAANNSACTWDFRYENRLIFVVASRICIEMAVSLDCTTQAILAPALKFEHWWNTP